MENWREYFKTFTALIIVICFLEMLLPSNEIKKFAKLSFGLVVMFAILQPILAIVNLDFRYDSQLSQVFAGSETPSTVSKDWENEAYRLQQAGLQPITKTFEFELNRQIEALALTIEGVNDVKSTLTFDNQGELFQVQLEIEFDKEQSEERIQRVIAHYFGLDKQNVLIRRLGG